MKSRKFVDSVVLHAQAGQGGNGCVSFRREKYLPRGGPNGGDGGRGGHVILRTDPDTTSLEHILFSPDRRAPNGGHGKGKQIHGRNGRDLIVKLPCGTEVYDADTGARLADLVDPGAEVTVARGGRGGLGNVHWKTSTHQAPREHTSGGAGETGAIGLQLKLVSDVGLVGFPNAGKSSLLTRLSDAHPRIAPYPFTTLNPIVGTLIFEDYSRATVADIPGLIRGAHDGVGLGHAFLRHIERASALVIVLDMAGTDGRDPAQDLADLRQELALHDASLSTRPTLIVANKMDVPRAAETLTEFRSATGVDPLCVSAATGNGIPELKDTIRRLCRPHEG